ncbi:hypothetical protein [Dyadobacter sp. 3J3]|uniref:hypothetical protein n=1 Tax=Dyadobacter sp. 3J3 TaxID=2606600 RepID=UPI001359A9DB|nr:hypothetical protein [Dyadobacter sp. 3J3]
MNIHCACLNSILLILLLNLSTSTFAQDNKATETITYKLISNDAEILGNNDTEVQTCVDLLNAATQRIKRNFPGVNFSVSDTNTSIKVLKTIDSLFTEFGFLFFTEEKNIAFDFLTLAFRKKYLADDYLHFNRYRQAYFRSLDKRTCRLIDCDLYCLIYLGIAQMNHLPLSMVELPKHNFIRWNLPGGGSINWEAIEGTYHLADSTLSCYHYLNSINRNYYLRPWSLSQVYCYYYTLRAATYDYNPTYLNSKKARRDYKIALSYSTSQSVTLNNLVWMHVVHPEFDSELDYPKLFAMMDTAIGQLNDRNYYDTKAGLYAQKKDFKNAIICIRQGISVENDPDNVLSSCKRHLSWFEQGLSIREGRRRFPGTDN